MDTHSPASSPLPAKASTRLFCAGKCHHGSGACLFADSAAVTSRVDDAAEAAALSQQKMTGTFSDYYARTNKFDIAANTASTVTSLALRAAPSGLTSERSQRTFKTPYMRCRPSRQLLHDPPWDEHGTNQSIPVDPTASGGRS